MKILFDETFERPIEEVYSYFRPPRDWVRLYGVAGEVRFTVQGEGVRLEGYETISIRWLGFLSPLVEVFLKKEFTGIWNLGWRRLRKGRGAAS